MDGAAIPDQQREWDVTYRAQGAARAETDPSELAREVLPCIPVRARLLELGCGRGVDARWFAEAGHRVVATDFSAEALAQSRARYGDVPGLSFILADHSQRLPFGDACFDVVYASLSLHYFRDAVTRRMFREITRVLKPHGTLAFVCKSTEDPFYGQGQRVEDDMFVRDGHVRHFFSEAYARSCLAAEFVDARIWSGRTAFYGEPSAFVKVIARRVP